MVRRMLGGAGLVGVIVAGTLISAPALAGEGSVGLTGSVVGAESVGVRPGISLGYLPTPGTAIELHGDMGVDGAWDAGLMLAGRLYLPAGGTPGQGIFLLGRVGAGIAGTDGTVGPWTTIAGGFGARPVSWLSIEAFGGPEWAMADGGRWRTGLTVSTVFGGGQGKKNERHRPDRKPG
jgi:hypothetical protein